jgi:hypothetical protein
MRFFFATQRRSASPLSALSGGLPELYPVTQDLPDAIARAFARLDSSTKPTPPSQGPPNERAAA